MPTLSKGELLVKVHAAALNPVGYKMMKFVPNFIARRPHVVEQDFSGVVVDNNGDVLTNGQAVFGWIEVPLMFKTGQGALAEYLKVPATHVVEKPENVSFEEAAGFALAGMTAYQALVSLANIEAGQSVFINGGSTAVGGYAIQIAKAKGCHVVASCSGTSAEQVKNLGADQIFDYRASPLVAQLKKNTPNPKFHVLFDTVCASRDLFDSCPAYLAPNGVYISVAFQTGGFFKSLWDNIYPSLIPSWLGGVKRRFKTVAVANKKNDLQALQKLVREGKIRPMVDSVHSFEDVPMAYERIMSNRAKGKVVVAVSATQTNAMLD